MSQHKTDGRSIIKIKVVADPNNVVVSPNSDFDYAVSLTTPLDPGQYEAMVTLSGIGQTGAGTHTPYILTSDFQVR